MHTVALAVLATVAAGTMHGIIAVDSTDSAEITAAEPVLSTWPQGVYVNAIRVPIVVDKIIVGRINDQTDNERLQRRLAATHRQS
jgi:hypothetical protein